MKCRTTYTLLLLTSLLTTLLGCTKDSADEEEPIVTATITINSPGEGAVFHNGDSIIVEGTAVGTGVLHGYEISIRKANESSNPYYFQHIHNHSSTIQFREGWKNNLTAPTNLEVVVDVIVDHEGNKNSKKFGIRVE
jgi:hypothetical protein